MAVQLIDELKPKRVLFCTDSVGKEEAFILLGKHYKVKVAVNRSRMAYIDAITGSLSQSNVHFTLDPSATWLQLIPKHQKAAALLEWPGSIAITLTGWANISHPQPDGERSYLLPYSLHSNFE